MIRRRREAPSNESVAVVPVFGVDPNGAAIFTGAVNGTVGHLNSRVVIDANDAPWHGWTAQPQHYRGAASAGHPVIDPTTTLDQARSTPGLSPMQSLMEQRASRGLY